MMNCFENLKLGYITFYDLKKSRENKNSSISKMFIKICLR